MEANKQHVSVLSVLLVRLRFIFVFVVVGLVVARWDLLRAYVDRWTRPAKTATSSELEYYCPMHPNIVKDEPGDCPLCSMALSKRKKGEVAPLPSGVAARLQLSPMRIHQAGLQTEEVAYRTLIQEIRAVGFIQWDERRLAHLSARIAGRADELYVNFVGQKVKKGDPVYRLYSPDLVSTQEEYLLARKTLEEEKLIYPANESALDTARRMMESARQRLILWGISEAQIAGFEQEGKAQTYLTIESPISGTVIEKEIHCGHYVQVGEDPYTIYDDTVSRQQEYLAAWRESERPEVKADPARLAGSRDRIATAHHHLHELGIRDDEIEELQKTGTAKPMPMVWMMAEIFERDIPLVEVGQAIEVTSEAYPGESFNGVVAFIQPELSKETRTVSVRVDVPNPDERLKPGMYVDATLRMPLGKRGEVFYGC